MIDVYTWTTGNSRKIPIFLEEAEVPYRLHMIDIRNGEQFKPDFVAICPNSKVPAIIDQDGPGGKPLSLFESGAILIYLADKYGKFIGNDAAGRYRVIEWVMFQMANVGPMFGQANHFLNKTPEKIPYAINRYVKEAVRLYKLLDKRLGEVEYLAGDYSIADIDDLCLAAQSLAPGSDARRLSQHQALVQRDRQRGPPCSARTRRSRKPERTTRR